VLRPFSVSTLTRNLKLFSLNFTTLQITGLLSFSYLILSHVHYHVDQLLQQAVLSDIIMMMMIIIFLTLGRYISEGV